MRAERFVSTLSADRPGKQRSFAAISRNGGDCQGRRKLAQTLNLLTSTASPEVRNKMSDPIPIGVPLTQLSHRFGSSGSRRAEFCRFAVRLINCGAK
jgi:hypothetical protein